MLDEGQPLFQQIARQVADGVLAGTFPEGTQVPSTTELSALHRINPATVGKGLALLVADEVLHKRRGLGMFVSEGARGRLVGQRRSALAATYVRPLVEEARSLGLDLDEVHHLVDAVATAAGAAASPDRGARSTGARPPGHHERPEELEDPESTAGAADLEHTVRTDEHEEHAR